MNYVDLMKEKNQILKELQDKSLPKGDRIILERKLNKIQEKIKEIEETTTSADIAQVTPNLMSKDKKKKLLRKPKLDELEESVSFEQILNLDEIGEFKL